jgi:hypothetical protein
MNPMCWIHKVSLVAFPRVSVWPERRVGVVGTSLKIGGGTGGAGTQFRQGVPEDRESYGAEAPIHGLS